MSIVNALWLLAVICLGLAILCHAKAGSHALDANQYRNCLDAYRHHRAFHFAYNLLFGVCILFFMGLVYLANNYQVTP